MPSLACARQGADRRPGSGCKPFRCVQGSARERNEGAACVWLLPEQRHQRGGGRRCRCSRQLLSGPLCGCDVISGARLLDMRVLHVDLRVRKRNESGRRPGLARARRKDTLPHRPRRLDREGNTRWAFRRSLARIRRTWRGGGAARRTSCAAGAKRGALLTRSHHTVLASSAANAAAHTHAIRGKRPLGE